MKVALIHPRILLKGGLETRLFNYIDFSRNRGDEITVITAKIGKEVSIPEKVSILKINLSHIPKPIRMLFFNSGLRNNKFDFSLSLGRTVNHSIIKFGTPLHF